MGTFTKRSRGTFVSTWPGSCHSACRTPPLRHSTMPHPRIHCSSTTAGYRPLPILTLSPPRTIIQRCRTISSLPTSCLAPTTFQKHRQIRTSPCQYPPKFPPPERSLLMNRLFQNGLIFFLRRVILENDLTLIQRLFFFFDLHLKTKTITWFPRMMMIDDDDDDIFCLYLSFFLSLSFSLSFSSLSSFFSLI